jgi:hypothetical protein
MLIKENSMNLVVVIGVVIIGGNALYNCLTKNTTESWEMLKAIATGSIIWWSLPYMFNALVKVSTVWLR